MSSSVSRILVAAVLLPPVIAAVWFGGWWLFAFHLTEPNGEFGGYLSDPMPVEWGPDGNLQVAQIPALEADLRSTATLREGAALQADVKRAGVAENSFQKRSR